MYDCEINMVLINLIQAIKLKTHDEKKLCQDLSTIEKNATSIYDNFIIKNVHMNLKTLNFQFYAFTLGQIDTDTQFF